MEFIESTNDCKIRNISSPLYEVLNWMKFVGVSSIVSGVISIFSLFGIAFAWLPIWMGVLLYKAANEVDLAHTTKDEQALKVALKNLKTYFVINGILLILSFVGIILFIVFSSLVLLVFREWLS
jgi:hypothetical protein